MRNRCGAQTKILWAAILLVPLLPLAQGVFEPARLDTWEPPMSSPNVVAWGQEWLSVSVDAAGVVTQMTPLREALAFSDDLRGAIREWSFVPARADGEPVSSVVLVTAVFVPAELGTLPDLNRPPMPAASQSPVPIASPLPAYPPRAKGSGIVLVEVTVDENGAVGLPTLVSSATGFDTAALDTARRWQFYPATRRQRRVSSVVYLLFSFLEPVVEPPVRR